MITFLFLACVSAPISREPSNNVEIPVDTLFEKDGCTVYRFKDTGHYHYFVKCKSVEPASTMDIKACGKNCFYEDSIPTLEGK